MLKKLPLLFVVFGLVLVLSACEQPVPPTSTVAGQADLQPTVVAPESEAKPQEEGKAENQSTKQEQAQSKQESPAVSKAPKPKEPSVASKVQTPKPQQPKDEVISPQQAKSVAFAHAKVNESKVVGLKVELERDNGKLFYEVEFYAGGSEFEYKIHANSQEILSAEKDDRSILQVAKYISTDRAIGVALKHAGVAKTEVRELNAELEDGVNPFYEVDFEHKGVEYEYRIDAQNGNILHHRNEID